MASSTTRSSSATGASAGRTRSRVRAVVLLRVDAAAPVVSPAYDAGASEEDVVRRWRDHHLGLAEARLAGDGAEDS